MSKHVGYIRVSSAGQNTARQLVGVELNKTYTDETSGKNTKRPELEACIAFLREDDVLHVHSIDRLARNLEDLQKLVKGLNKKEVTVVFEKEQLTFAPDSSSPMAQLQLQLMGAFAQFERSLIKERQLEGIKAAQAAGKHMGRKATLSADQIVEIKAKIADGELKKDLAVEYGVSRQTIYKSLERAAKKAQKA